MLLDILGELKICPKPAGLQMSILEFICEVHDFVQNIGDTGS